jgi:hypothetical protein
VAGVAVVLQSRRPFRLVFHMHYQKGKWRVRYLGGGSKDRRFVLRGAHVSQYIIEHWNGDRGLI